MFQKPDRIIEIQMIIGHVFGRKGKSKVSAEQKQQQQQRQILQKRKQKAQQKHNNKSTAEEKQ